MIAAELRRLHEAATSGPFYLFGAPWLPRGCETAVLSGSPDPHVAKMVCDFECQSSEESDAPESNGWNDAEFIAYLLNHTEAILALIAAAEKCRTLIEDDFGTIDDSPAKCDRGSAALNAVTEALKPFTTDSRP